MPTDITHPMILRYRKFSIELLEDLTKNSRAFISAATDLHNEKRLSDDAYIAAWNELIAASVAACIGPILASADGFADAIAAQTIGAIEEHLSRACADRKLTLTMEWSVEKTPSIITIQ